MVVVVLGLTRVLAEWIGLSGMSWRLGALAGHGARVRRWLGSLLGSYGRGGLVSGVGLRGDPNPRAFEA
ncbi:MAG: hypothetical protein QOG25_3857, partial [Acetobacteraceae bacterium]|nr:hypothetical protein [Acetobacteraceae bacterium]